MFWDEIRFRLAVLEMARNARSVQNRKVEDKVARECRQLGHRRLEDTPLPVNITDAGEVFGIHALSFLRRSDCRRGKSKYFIVAFQQKNVAGSGLSMNLQVKAVDEKRLEHLPQDGIFDSKNGVPEILNARAIGIGGLCFHGVLIGMGPGLTARNLPIACFERCLHERLQGETVYHDSSPWKHLNAHHARR